jgi:hypothetical protein
MGRFLTAAALSALSACGFSAVHSAPMGQAQYMVACVDSPFNCAREANRLCPSGYNVTSNTTNQADFGRMTMIIKCG